MSAQSRFLYAHSLIDEVWYNRLGRVAMPSNVRDANFKVSEKHQQAYDRYLNRTLEAYRRSQANMTPDQQAEQQAEISANFAPGEEVVNVLTGKRWKA